MENNMISFISQQYFKNVYFTCVSTIKNIFKWKKGDSSLNKEIIKIGNVNFVFHDIRDQLLCNV